MSEYLKDYAVQLIHIQPNDVILLHVSEDLYLDDVATIQNEVQHAFPNNTILVANEDILKKITVFRPDQPMIIADGVSNIYDPEQNWLKTSSSDFFTDDVIIGGNSTYDVLY